MAPREQKAHGSGMGAGGLDYRRPVKALDTTAGVLTGPTASSQHKENQEHHGHGHGHGHGERIIFFKIGPLRFGLHGVSGMLGTICVSYALYLSYCTASRKIEQLEDNTNHLNWSDFSSCTHTPLWLAIAIITTTLQSSIGSYGLLNQVPKSTKIASWIYPPHREAFKRTIAIAVYLNIRLIHLWICYHQLLKTRNIDDNNMNMNMNTNKSNDRIYENVLFPIGLFIYTNYNFFPINFDYSNGNSFVFVLPMFIGLNIDTFQQFPKFTAITSTSTSTTTTTTSATSMIEWIRNYMSLVHAKFGSNYNNYENSSSSSFSYLDWDDVHTWNTTKVNETYLLITLLCTLQIAFMFTIAFRGRMNIKFCYWIAALEVGLLSVRLFRK